MQRSMGCANSGMALAAAAKHLTPSNEGIHAEPTGHTAALARRRHGLGEAYNLPNCRLSRLVGRPLKSALGSRNMRRFSATSARRCTLPSVSS